MRWSAPRAPTLPALSRGRAARTGGPPPRRSGGRSRRPTSSRRSIRSRADRSRSRRQAAPRIIVGVAPGADLDAVAASLRPYASSLQILRAVGEVALVASNAAAVADLAAHDPRIEFAEPDRSLRGTCRAVRRGRSGHRSRLRLAVRRRPGGARDRRRRGWLVDDRRRRRQRCRRRAARPGRPTASGLRRDAAATARCSIPWGTARSSRVSSRWSMATASGRRASPVRRGCFRCARAWTGRSRTTRRSGASRGRRTTGPA